MTENKSWIGSLVGAFDDSPNYEQIMANEKAARRRMEFSAISCLPSVYAITDGSEAWSKNLFLASSIRSTCGLTIVS